MSGFDTIDPSVGYILLGLAAMMEYIFPPFPGDTIILSGAVFVQTRGWSALVVLVSVTAGSVLGAWVAYETGVWLKKTDRDSWLHRKVRSEPFKRSLDGVLEKFSRHGVAYVLINRFLPGVRAFVFVAAGMAGLSRAKTLLLAVASATLWNIGIIALGGAIGFNLDDMLTFFTTYTNIFYALVVVVVVLWLLKTRPWRKPQDS